MYANYDSDFNFEEQKVHAFAIHNLEYTHAHTHTLGEMDYIISVFVDINYIYFFFIDFSIFNSFQWIPSSMFSFLLCLFTMCYFLSLPCTFLKCSSFFFVCFIHELYLSFNSNSFKYFFFFVVLWRLAFTPFFFPRICSLPIILF